MNKTNKDLYDKVLKGIDAESVDFTTFDGYGGYGCSIFGPGNGSVDEGCLGSNQSIGTVAYSGSGSVSFSTPSFIGVDETSPGSGWNVYFMSGCYLYNPSNPVYTGYITSSDGCSNSFTATINPINCSLTVSSGSTTANIYEDTFSTDSGVFTISYNGPSIEGCCQGQGGPVDLTFSPALPSFLSVDTSTIGTTVVSVPAGTLNYESVSSATGEYFTKYTGIYYFESCIGNYDITFHDVNEEPYVTISYNGDLCANRDYSDNPVLLSIFQPKDYDTKTLEYRSLEVCITGEDSHTANSFFLSTGSFPGSPAETCVSGEAPMGNVYLYFSGITSAGNRWYEPFISIKDKYGTGLLDEYSPAFYSKTPYNPTEYTYEGFLSSIPAGLDTDNNTYITIGHGGIAAVYNTLAAPRYSTSCSIKAISDFTNIPSFDDFLYNNSNQNPENISISIPSGKVAYNSGDSYYGYADYSIYDANYVACVCYGLGGTFAESVSVGAPLVPFKTGVGPSIPWTGGAGNIEDSYFVKIDDSSFLMAPKASGQSYTSSDSSFYIYNTGSSTVSGITHPTYQSVSEVAAISGHILVRYGDDPSGNRFHHYDITGGSFTGIFAFNSGNIQRMFGLSDLTPSENTFWILGTNESCSYYVTGFNISATTYSTSFSGISSNICLVPKFVEHGGAYQIKDTADQYYIFNTDYYYTGLGDDYPLIYSSNNISKFNLGVTGYLHSKDNVGHVADRLLISLHNTGTQINTFSSYSNTAQEFSSVTYSGNAYKLLPLSNQEVLWYSYSGTGSVSNWAVDPFTMVSRTIKASGNFEFARNNPAEFRSLLIRESGNDAIIFNDLDHTFVELSFTGNPSIGQYSDSIVSDNNFYLLPKYTYGSFPTGSLISLSTTATGPTGVVLTPSSTTLTEQITPSSILVSNISYLGEDEFTDATTLSLSGLYSNLFELSGNSLYVASGIDLDYETTTQYTVNVLATDIYVGSVASGLFTLNISDVDEPPTGVDFTPDSENVQGGYDFGGNPLQLATFTLLDPDSTTGNIFTITGTDASYFSGNYNPSTNSGNFYILETTLDYAVKEYYTGIIVAKQSGALDYTATGSFVLRITDAPPTSILITPSSISLNEETGNPAVYSNIATLVLGDPDTTSGNIVESIGPDQSLFSVSYNDALNSGDITFSPGGLDYETRNEYTGQFGFKQSGASEYAGTGYLYVSINNVDEPPTGFAITIVSGSIDENYNFGGTDYLVATYSLLDPDSTTNNTVILSGLDATYFTTSYDAANNSGNLSLKSSISVDYETKQDYTGILLGKISTDSAYTASGELVIAVNPIDEPPTGIVLTPTSYNIDENYDFGGSSLQIASFVVLDPDDVVNISAIVTGVDKDYFSVTYNNSLNSGALFLVETGLDYETKNSITGIVAISDQTPFSLQASGTIVVSLNDANDPPTISISPSSITVPEQTFASSSGISTITITDQDSNPSFLSDNTVSITGLPTDTGIFEIVGNTGLAIKAGTILDYELQDVYTIDLIVSNNLGASDTGSFTLNVSDVAEPPTGISLTPSSLSIDENYNFNGSNYFLSNVVVFDSDVTNTDNIFYVTGADADVFVLSMNASVGTGTLLLDSSTSLDYETKNSYTGIVVAKQTGTNISVSGYFYLTVNDIAECPSIDITPSAVSVLETQTFASNYKVSDITITDPDALNNNSVYITGLAADTGIFTIIGTGLYIKAGTTLDYETKTQYPIQIVVSDTGIPCSDTGNFTLNINNVPDVAADILFACPRIYVPQNATDIDILLSRVYTTGGEVGAVYDLSLSGSQAGDFTLDGYNRLYWNSGSDFGVSGDTNSVYIVSSGVGGGPSGISSELFTFNVVDDMPLFVTGVVDGVLSEWHHYRGAVEFWPLTGQPDYFVMTNRHDESTTLDMPALLYNTTNNTTSGILYSSSYFHSYPCVASDKLFTAIEATADSSAQTFIAVYDFNTTTWSTITSPITRSSTAYTVDYLMVLDDDHLLMMSYSTKYLNLYKISTGQSYAVDTSDISSSYIANFIFTGSHFEIEDGIFLFFPRGFSMFNGMGANRQYPWRLDINNPGTSLELLRGSVNYSNINWVNGTRSGIDFYRKHTSKVGNSIILVDSQNKDLHVYDITSSGATHYSSGIYGYGPAVAMSQCEGFVASSGFHIYDDATSGITQVLHPYTGGGGDFPSFSFWNQITTSTGVHDYFAVGLPYPLPASGFVYNNLTKTVQHFFTGLKDNDHHIYYHNNSFYLVPSYHNDSSDEYVIVLAANKSPTDISVSPSSVSLPENTNTDGGYSLGTILLSDDGVGTNVIYITGAASDTGIFQIVNNTGLIIEDGTTLDYENKNQYNIYVVAYDVDSPSQTVSGSFTLNITDVNEPPSVTLDPISVSLVENTDTTNRIFLSEITINDDALGTNVLSIGGADSGVFEIINNTGLYLKSGILLDYDIKTNYAAVVNVVDNALGSSNSAGFNLFVTEGNDAPSGLLFSPPTGLVQNEQVLTANFKIADIIIVDDGHVDSNNELFISGIADASSFYISGTELYLVSGLDLNYEIKNIYTGFIGVRDTGVVNSVPVIEPFTVEIADIDEDPTGIILSPVSGSIIAGVDTSTGVFLADITIQDPDTGLSFQQNDIFASSIFDISFSPGLFNVYENSGLTAKLGIASGADIWALYDLATVVTGVVYYSGAISTSLHTNFELTINSGNRQPSGLVLESGTVNIPENTSTTSGILISYFSYIDDSHPDNNVDIYVTGLDSSAFVINGSGIYISGVSLDFETKNRYSGFLTIEDTGIFPLLTTTSGFVVNITDVDECPTSLQLSPTGATINNSIDTTNGVYLSEIILTDDALGINYFSLTGVDATGFQIVNGNDLILKSGQPISDGTMTVDVVASGSGCPSVLSETFTLNIVAQNTGPSAVNISPSTISLNEHIYNANGIDLATYTLSDDGHPDSVNFVSLIDNTYFVLDTGLRKISLRPGVVLDYETRTSYTGYVTAVDLGTTDPAVTGMFVLNVLQWNEAPTGLSFSPTTGSVDEDIDASAGSVYVATISVLDDGHVASNNELSLNGLDSLPFELSGLDIRIKSGEIFDYETKSSYTFDVIVQDTGVYGSSPFVTGYTININDINECPTGIVLSPSSGSVLIGNYDINQTTFLSNITLQDEDASASGDFRLTGIDASMFVLSGINSYQQGLYLNSGLTLSTGDYSVDVVINDNSLTCVDITGSFDLSIVDVDLPPTSLTINFVSPVYESFGTYYIDEMIDISTGVKIADIVIGDPDVDSNTILFDPPVSGLIIDGREIYLSGSYDDGVINFFGHTDEWLRNDIKNSFVLHLKAGRSQDLVSTIACSGFPSTDNTSYVYTTGYVTQQLETANSGTTIRPSGTVSTSINYYNNHISYELNGENAVVFRAGDFWDATNILYSYYRIMSVFFFSSAAAPFINQVYYTQTELNSYGFYVQNDYLYFRHHNSTADVSMTTFSPNNIIEVGLRNKYPFIKVYQDDTFDIILWSYRSSTQVSSEQPDYLSFRWVRDAYHESYHPAYDCAIAHDITLCSGVSSVVYADETLYVADIDNNLEPHYADLTISRPTSSYLWKNMAKTGDVTVYSLSNGLPSNRVTAEQEYLDYSSFSGLNLYTSGLGFTASGLSIVLQSGSTYNLLTTSPAYSLRVLDTDYSGWYNDQTVGTVFYRISNVLSSGSLSGLYEYNINENSTHTQALQWGNTNPYATPSIKLDFSSYPEISSTITPVTFNSVNISISGFNYEQYSQVTGVFVVEDPTVDDGSLSQLVSRFIFNVADVDEPADYMLLDPSGTTIPETTNLSNSLKLSDISFGEDQIGTYVIYYLSDTDRFEISGDNTNTPSLYLKAGADIDYESNVQHVLQINAVENPYTAGDPIFTGFFTLDITDVDEPPVIALNVTSAEFEEYQIINTDTLLANIYVVDEDHDTVSLHVAGDYANRFKIIEQSFTSIPGSSILMGSLYLSSGQQIPSYVDMISFTGLIVGTDVAGNTGTGNFIINIQDVADCNPYYSGTFNKPTCFGNSDGSMRYNVSYTGSAADIAYCSTNRELRIIWNNLPAQAVADSNGLSVSQLPGGIYTGTLYAGNVPTDTLVADLTPIEAISITDLVINNSPCQASGSLFVAWTGGTYPINVSYNSYFHTAETSDDTYHTFNILSDTSGDVVITDFQGCQVVSSNIQFSFPQLRTQFIYESQEPPYLHNGHLQSFQFNVINGDGPYEIFIYEANGTEKGTLIDSIDRYDTSVFDHEEQIGAVATDSSGNPYVAISSANITRYFYDIGHKIQAGSYILEFVNLYGCSFDSPVVTAIDTDPISLIVNVSNDVPLDRSFAVETSPLLDTLFIPYNLIVNDPELLSYISSIHAKSNINIQVGDTTHQRRALYGSINCDTYSLLNILFLGIDSQDWYYPLQFYQGYDLIDTDIDIINTEKYLVISDTKKIRIVNRLDNNPNNIKMLKGSILTTDGNTDQFRVGADIALYRFTIEGNLEKLGENVNVYDTSTLVNTYSAGDIFNINFVGNESVSSYIRSDQIASIDFDCQTQQRAILNYRNFLIQYNDFDNIDNLYVKAENSYDHNGIITLTPAGGYILQGIGSITYFSEFYSYNPQTKRSNRITINNSTTTENSLSQLKHGTYIIKFRDSQGNKAITVNGLSYEVFYEDMIDFIINELKTTKDNINFEYGDLIVNVYDATAISRSELPPIIPGVSEPPSVDPVSPTLDQVSTSTFYLSQNDTYTNGLIVQTSPVKVKFEIKGPYGYHQIFEDRTRLLRMPPGVYHIQGLKEDLDNKLLKQDKRTIVVQEKTEILATLNFVSYQDLPIAEEN